MYQLTLLTRSKIDWTYFWETQEIKYGLQAQLHKPVSRSEVWN